MLTNLEWFLMLWLALVIFANAILGGECLYWRRKCEQKSGNCVMVHSLMRHDVCNEENCSSFRALKTQGDAQ